MTKTGAVWGLDNGRPGEFMQVAVLGQALGLDFERITISSEGLPLAALPDLPPRLILSFGRAAKAALRVAAGYNTAPLLVHLGTPGHLPVTAFDLIIPMPQDDYPPAANVQFIDLPLNGAGAVAGLPDPELQDLPPACTVIIGGPSRHFRINPTAIRRLLRFSLRLAKANSEALRVVTSPRTPPAVLAELRRLRDRQGFALHAYGDTAFTRLLRSGSRFVVTADSASMLAEACRTGAPVWLFNLPAQPNLSDFLQYAADRCFGVGLRHRLVRLGWVGGGTDFARWHRRLERLGVIRTARRQPEAELRWSPSGGLPDTDLRDCQARILSLLAEKR